jgi:hypothetical protein
MKKLRQKQDHFYVFRFVSFQTLDGTINWIIAKVVVSKTQMFGLKKPFFYILGQVEKTLF